MAGRAPALICSLALFGAVSTPAPALFSPPVGWTPNPQLASAPMPAIWRRDFGRLESSLTIQPLPLPILVNGAAEQAITQSLRDGGATVTVTNRRFCGNPGRLAIAQMAKRKTVVEFAFESSGGTSYLIEYSRPLAVAEDPVAVAFVTHACPSSPKNVASLVGPTGWSLVPPQAIVAAWMGPNFGDSLVEVSGAPAASAADDVRDRMLQFSSGDNGDPDIVVTRRPSFSVCGREAAESVMEMKSPMLDVYTDVVSLQTPDRSYTLSYTTFQPAFDAKTIAAMHAFCPARE